MNIQYVHMHTVLYTDPVYQYCILTLEKVCSHSFSIGVFTCIQYCIPVLEKISTGAIHSGQEYRHGVQYRMHVNTSFKNCGSKCFSSISIQYWYTGSVYSTGCM